MDLSERFGRFLATPKGPGITVAICTVATTVIFVAGVLLYGLGALGLLLLAVLTGVFWGGSVATAAILEVIRNVKKDLNVKYEGSD